MNDINETPYEAEDPSVTDPSVDIEGGEERAPDPVEILASENADLRDKLLRLAADMENLRKRTSREISDARAYAVTSFARDMLTATDNLTRALLVVTQEARDAADATTKSLIDGIEMTEREMFRLLEKNGITPIEAEGQKFDPHRHQAMLEVSNPDVPEGTVVQVLQAGFAIGDRILRPALVGVAKGGRKSTPAPDAEPGNEVDKQA